MFELKGFKISKVIINYRECRFTNTMRADNGTSIWEKSTQNRPSPLVGLIFHKEGNKEEDVRNISTVCWLK